MITNINSVFSTLIAGCSALTMPLFGATAKPVPHPADTKVEYIEHPAIAKILKELPHHGVLTQRESDGAIYLKVSEDYLNKLFPVIQEIYADSDLVKGSSSVGAHISVVRPSLGEPVLRNIPELNGTIDFTPVRLGTVVPDLDPKWERVWILEVHAQALEDLRLSYGLSPGVGGTDNKFHITIATKLRKDLPN
jgi:Swiss Army Knife, 2H phosphoesterase domain